MHDWLNSDASCSRKLHLSGSGLLVGPSVKPIVTVLTDVAVVDLGLVPVAVRVHPQTGATLSGTFSEPAARLGCSASWVLTF